MRPPGYASAPVFHSRIILQRALTTWAIGGMSDHVPGTNTVTPAPGWSLSRTVETTLNEGSGSVSVEPTLSPCSHDLPWEQ